MDIDKLITKIQAAQPDINFRPAETFYWSPTDQTVYYCNDDNDQESLWALLHETGHGILGHKQYFSDFELVKMEVEAWEKAKELASRLMTHDSPIIPDEDHIQDCLDSYRDWLHKRSLCPDCHLSSIQIDEHTYTCVFCHKRWRVTAERFCRPYRKVVAT